MASLFMLSGCLIDDPPPYTAPTRTPARLDTTGAFPPLDQIVIAKTTDPLKFTVPFVSEDAGFLVTAFLLLDYDGDPFANFPALAAKDFPPAALDVVRTIDITPRIPGGLKGCHRITLRVTHKVNISSASPELIDPADNAEAYWFVYFNPEPDVPVSLLDCPRATQGAVQ